MWFARDFRSASRVRWAASGGCAEVRERERDGIAVMEFYEAAVCVYIRRRSLILTEIPARWVRWVSVHVYMPRCVGGRKNMNNRHEF